MIRRVYVFARKESGTFVRFLFVGGLSFAINIGTYALLSRWIFPQGSRVLENAIAIACSVLFNFAAHRAWTYRSTEKHVGQLLRYAFVVVCAAALQSSLFWLWHVWLGFHDLFVIILATAISAAGTFFAHRFFTFESRTDVV